MIQGPHCSILWEMEIQKCYASPVHLEPLWFGIRLLWLGDLNFQVHSPKHPKAPWKTDGKAPCLDVQHMLFWCLESMPICVPAPSIRLNVVTLASNGTGDVFPHAYHPYRHAACFPWWARGYLQLHHIAVLPIDLSLDVLRLFIS